MPEKTRSVKFKTKLSSFGNNTGIEVPKELVEKLGGGKRPAVIVNVNGYEYRNTVAVMGGKHLISVSAAIRKKTGLKGGDPIAVMLTATDEPRPVNIPKDLAAAFKKNPAARKFFEGLSNSLQRYHIDNIEAAKAAETRQRRIDKSIALLLEGKPR